MLQPPYMHKRGEEGCYSSLATASTAVANNRSRVYRERMMKIAASIVLVCAFALCVSAQCSAKITWKARSDQYSSWYIGATHYQIYDIVVTNEGSCVLTSILGLFTAVGAGGFVSEGWNYDITTGIFSGYGGALQIGQSFYGAGFVLANSSQPNLSKTQNTCDASCNAGTSAPTTSAPTTSAPTNTPTTSAPTTSAPTNTPTTSAPTTSAPNTCAVTASVARDANWWMDSQGRNNSVYRLTISNAGPCALKTYVLSFGFGAGVLISDWNLVSVLGGYQVTGYGPQLAAGQSYSAAGMILAGAPDHISVAPYGSTCAC